MSDIAPEIMFYNTFFNSTDVFKNSAVLVVSPVNRKYFTGFCSSNGAVLVTKERVLFFTDFRYIISARNNVKNIEVVESSDILKSVAEILSHEKIENLYIEQGYITVSELERYKSILNPIKIVCSNLADGIIRRLRSVKNDNELLQIKKAQKITELSFEHILGFIREGVTEKEIALELEFFMRKNGAERVAFDLIVASGENGACPHAVPSEKPVSRGDFITMDIGAVYNGYHSDMTRTVALGEISQEQNDIYNTVLRAQLEAISKVKAGVSCCDVDSAARTVIEIAGFGDFFGHSTGHGVGLEIHEAPNVSLLSSSVLSEGMVITVEPGIYLPNKFGVRIEDMLFVTENGYENLTNTPKDILIL